MIPPETSLPPNRSAQTFGRYRVDAELGRGYSSIVYDAEDTATGERVALKVLTSPPAVPPSRRQEMAGRFEREARAVSALSHPAIVAIYDVGQDQEGRQFLAMERLEGETLRARIERHGPLLRSEALPWMVQIADALQFAHGRGIIHRDVKPDNIFLCRDGRAKLMDFGIAHVFADEGLTQTGTLVGSPAYMSPEQINGESLDGRTDVFSLAVTLAEALTGRKPFDGPSIPTVMNRILNQPPQIGGIPAGPLRKALEQALAKKPQARTPSAGAFAETLRRAAPYSGTGPLTSITGTQVMPRPIFAGDHAPRWTPLWIGGGAAALGLGALLALIPLSHPQASLAPQVSVVYPPAPAAPKAAMPTAPRRHVGSAPPAFHIQITENDPAPASAPLTLDTLHALRNNTPTPASLPQRASAYSFSNTASTRDLDWQPMSSHAFHKEVSAQEMPAPPVQPAVHSFSLPRLLQSTTPQLPLNTPAGELPTTVSLLVSVNESGHVADAQVTQSSGDRSLDTAAIANVLSWRYAPAQENGHPASAEISEQVQFTR